MNCTIFEKKAGLAIAEARLDINIFKRCTNQLQQRFTGKPDTSRNPAILWPFPQNQPYLSCSH